jgi:glutamate dehydrogenase
MNQACIPGHPIRLYNAPIPLRHRRASGHHKGSNRWSGRRSWIQYVSFPDIFPQQIFNAPTDEILLSHDKTVAIIDGSGVLADPTGINREELVRLAKARKPVRFFDKVKLSKDGYLVKLEDQDVKLPCEFGYAFVMCSSWSDFSLPAGETIPDGMDFRNSAHLRFKADLFVPCGGRYAISTQSRRLPTVYACSPEAVNISNVAALVDSEGKPHFTYVVEGANLFFTQQARLYLEQRKVVLFKDSSANKGGVTSSSLEVLAGLALATNEYLDLMIFKDGKPSEFYKSYVKDIQEEISENAAAESHCLWKEHAKAPARIRTPPFPVATSATSEPLSP